jgi:anti-sigma factor (TIGR02949 family)
MTDCRAIVHLLGAYLDGQLDAVKMLEVEEHVGACETCRERVELDRATRASLQRAAREQMPEDVRARLMAAMTAAAASRAAFERRDSRAASERRDSLDAADAETLRDDAISAVDEDRQTGERASQVPAPRPAVTASSQEVERLFGWRTMLPISAAAALALMWGSVARSPGQQEMQTVHAGFADDPLADLVAEHSRPLPPELRNPTDVRAFEPYVGVPIRPARLERAGARWVGARILPVHQERAAVLHYEIPQGSEVRRVSLFVYDPRRIQVGSSLPELSPRAVGTAEVLVGRTGGYSVAVTQRGGVGYAVATDLDPENSAQLAALVDED